MVIAQFGEFSVHVGVFEVRESGVGAEFLGGNGVMVSCMFVCVGVVRFGLH